MGFDSPATATPHTYTERERETDRQTETERENEGHRERERERGRQTDTGRYRDTYEVLNRRLFFVSVSHSRSPPPPL